MSDKDTNNYEGLVEAGFDDETNAIENELLKEISELDPHQASEDSDTAFGDTLDQQTYELEEPFEFELEEENEAVTTSPDSFLEDDLFAKNQSTEQEQSIEQVYDTKPEIAAEPVVNAELNTEVEPQTERNQKNLVNSEQQTPDEQSSPELEKKRNTPLLIAACVMFLAMVCGGAWFASDLMAHKPISISTSEEDVISVPNETATENAVETNGMNDAELYNGVEGVEPNTLRDIVNRDPEVGRYINELKSEHSRLQQELTQANDVKERLADEISSARSQLETMNQHSVSIEQENANLANKLTSAEEKFAALKNESKSEISKLQEEVKGLRLDNQKKDEDIVKIREQATLKEQENLKILETTNKQMTILLKRLDSFSVNQQQPKKPVRRAPLAELRYIGMDMTELAALFEVIRNGTPDKNPIRLKKGENLKGRGVIQNIDDYGCITFVTGKKYQPLNGNCK